MQTISLERSGLAQAWVVSLLTVAALVLLCLVLAQSTWAWFAPRPEPRAQPTTQTGGRMGAAYSLFGAAQPGRGGEAPTGIAVTLLGIVAAAGGSDGYALVQLAAKQTLVVREGDNIVPGIRLAEVRKDHIVLERGGVRETLAWPQKSAATEPTSLRANQ